MKVGCILSQSPEQRTIPPRWPPTNIANTPEEALSRLFMLPGARYSDAEF
jgi:hypothetical protein